MMGRRLNCSQGLRPRKRIGIATTVVRCIDCGLIYADPLPIPRSVEDHYGLEPGEYWPEDYFNVPPDHLKRELALCRQLAPHAKDLLDIGAGLGHNMIAALAYGFNVTGIEASKTFYDVAARKLGDRVMHTMLENADFPVGSFDVVSFNAVLEHLYDPAGAIEKVLRWLRPGGMVHIDVPDANYLLSKVYNLYFWLARTDYVVNISPMHPPFHLYEFTSESFVRHGEKAGYAVAHIQRYPGKTAAHRFTRYLDPIMNITGTGMGLVVYLQKR
jgi:SAM-dependent methyltransferase